MAERSINGALDLGAPIHVLLIDDDDDDFVLIRDLLADTILHRYIVEHVPDYDQGICSVCSGKFDVILLDYKLGAKTGLDLLTEARRLGCEAPVIMLTGLSDTEIDIAVMEQGADYYLEKSRLDGILLERTIRYAMQQREFEKTLELRVKERTEELDRANAALQLEARRKDEFISVLAHELRNPLAPIRNALEIMRLSGDAAHAVTPARTLLERQVAIMVRLIDDLLDVSRITRGKLRLNVETLTLAEVLDAALEQSKPNLHRNKQELVLDVPVEPVYIEGDRVRLAQVITNLMNNAAKFSEVGGKIMLVATHAKNQVTIRVRDNGMGIAPDMLEKIFEPFAQVDRLAQRNQGGLGIGLSLVRNLVEMHGGTVTATSKGVGKGADFTVVVPAKSSAKPL